MSDTKFAEQLRVSAFGQRSEHPPLLLLRSVHDPELSSFMNPRAGIRAALALDSARTPNALIVLLCTVSSGSQHTDEMSVGM
jgi:hypothetical protein